MSSGKGDDGLAQRLGVKPELAWAPGEALAARCGPALLKLGESPWNVPPWHADYFQPKTIKTHLPNEIQRDQLV